MMSQISIRKAFNISVWHKKHLNLFVNVENAQLLLFIEKKQVLIGGI